MTVADYLCADCMPIFSGMLFGLVIAILIVIFSNLIILIFEYISRKSNK